MALSKIQQSVIDNNEYPSYRNMLINGDIRMNQRGDASGVTATKYTGPDRWKFSISRDSAVFDVTQDDDVPSGNVGKSYKVSNTTSESSLAVDHLLRIQQRIEAQNMQHIKSGTSGAKNLTLSFWVKSSVAGEYGFTIYKPDQTERVYRKTYNIDTADTWQKIIHTIPGDTGGGGIDDNVDQGWRMGWYIYSGSDYSGGGAVADGAWGDYAVDEEHTSSAAGTTWATTDDSTFQLHNCQLEVGDIATEFEIVPIDVLLQRCQRYYFRFSSIGTSDERAVGFSRGGGTCWVPFHFPVTMRTTPSAFYTSGTASHFAVNKDSSTITCTSVPTNNSMGRDGGMISADVTTGLTVGDGNGFRFASSDAWLAWDAEI